MKAQKEARTDVVALLRTRGFEPYFESNGVALYHADGLDLLPCLPAEFFAATITDPPYCSGGTSASDRARDPVQKYCQGGDAKGRPSFGGDHLDQRSFAFWSTLWLRLAFRSMRSGGYALVFSDWRQLPTLTDALQASGHVWRGIIPWNKGRASRAPHTGYFRHQAEYVAWGTKGPCLRADGRGPFDGVINASIRRNQKLHITGKSLEAMRELVKVVAPGGSILEPFAGSSTTLAAAMLAGRPAIGIEREEAYCEISARRLSAIAAGRGPESEELPAAA